MKKLIAILSLLLAPVAFAAPTVLHAPDLGWDVRFNAPTMQKLDEQSTPAAYRYVGNAGKFNLSLYIEDPQCGGGASDKEQLQCFLGRLEKVPGLMKQTITMNQMPRAVQVSYLAYAQVNGVGIKVLHSHILFADKGKWGDLHGSVVKPDTAEIAMLLGLGDAFSFSN